MNRIATPHNVKVDTAIKEQAAAQEAAADTSGPRRMLNQEQVLRIVPVSPVTLWRMEKAGRFPKSTYISPNRRVWFADEISAWQAEINGRSRGRANHLAEVK
ncbi:AlpA family phage regulatory protein [Bradyrhizobium sp. 26S5]|uniref:helix-turn-helix transcriptional regulator n=1 Tax=Bradyrhizobium sp. 26S5 TaxID=3139729 RepID=UPI0030D152C3